MKPKVFVSYAHVAPDRDLAQQLKDYFSNRGLEVFLDATGIKVGDDWSDAIDQALRDSTHFVILLSEESVRRDMVRKEVEIAYRRKQNGDMQILPVRVDFTGELPYALGAMLDPLQYAQWKPGQPDAGLAEELLAKIDAFRPDTGVVHRSIEPPLPVAPTGTVSLSSAFYVERPEVIRLWGYLEQGDWTAIVKGARQMGKSSLLLRLRERAREKGFRVCYLDFTKIERRFLHSLRDLLQHIAFRIQDELQTPLTFESVWDDRRGDRESFARFLQEGVLRPTGGKFLLCLDEVPGRSAIFYFRIPPHRICGFAI